MADITELSEKDLLVAGQVVKTLLLRGKTVTRSVLCAELLAAAALTEDAAERQACLRVVATLSACGSKEAGTFIFRNGSGMTH